MRPIQQNAHWGGRAAELGEQIARSRLNETTGIKGVIAHGETETVEFKSTVRWCLNKNQKQKYITNASLKTICAFLNSKGGTLIIGIDDDAEPIGIETDQFENVDKFKLFLHDKISSFMGSHITGLVETHLHEYKGVQICEVLCKKSTNAVFLKEDGKETFYVRRGPSSKTLSGNALLAYAK